MFAAAPIARAQESFVPDIRSAQTRSNFDFSRLSKTITGENCEEDPLRKTIAQGTEDPRNAVFELSRKAHWFPLNVEIDCIDRVMQGGYWKSPKRFVTCKSQNGKEVEVETTKAPCRSLEYKKLTQSILNTTLYCLKDYLGGRQKFNPAVTEVDKARIDIFLAMIAQESGFHMHAKSHTGATGLAQLTSVAIQENNNNFRVNIGTLRNYLKNHPNKDCEVMSDILPNNKPMSPTAANRCDRVSLAKDNPMLNLIYGVANIVNNQEILARRIFNNPEYRYLFSGAISAKEKAELEMQFAIWAHNTGPGGLNSALTSLNRSLKEGGGAAAFSGLSTEAKIKKVSEHLEKTHKSLVGPTRAKEVKDYLPNLMARYRKMEAELGACTSYAALRARQKETPDLDRKGLDSLINNAPPLDRQGLDSLIQGGHR